LEYTKTKWKVSICVDRKQKFLSDFDDPLEGARRHDMYVVHLYTNEDGTYKIPLNKLNGENVLTNKEIQNIKANGIPEEHVKTTKVREYPPNIL